MFAVLRLDYTPDSDGAFGPVTSLDVIYSCCTEDEAAYLARVGSRDFATDGGYHTFTAWPMASLGQYLAEMGYDWSA